MLSKLIIPVIDTENSTFETDVKMSNEEFQYMQEQALLKTNSLVNDYMDRGYTRQNIKKEEINDKTSMHHTKANVYSYHQEKKKLMNNSLKICAIKRMHFY